MGAEQVKALLTVIKDDKWHSVRQRILAAQALDFMAASDDEEAKKIIDELLNTV